MHLCTLPLLLLSSLWLIRNICKGFLEMMPCKSPEPLVENTNLSPPSTPPPLPCKQSFVHKFREHCNFDEALVHRQIRYSGHPSSLSPLILQTLGCEAAAGACPSYLWEMGGSHPERVATLSPRNKKIYITTIRPYRQFSVDRFALRRV